MIEQKTEAVKIRIETTAKKELQKIAHDEGRTFAGQVKFALKEWLDRKKHE